MTLLLYYLFTRACSTGIISAIYYNTDLEQDRAWASIIVSLVPVLGEVFILSLIPYLLTDQLFRLYRQARRNYFSPGSR